MEKRGLGGRISLTDEALASLLDLSGGDARQALNILEAAASVAPDGADDRFGGGGGGGPAAAARLRPGR